MSRIEQLISEIEAYIDECKPQPFSNNKKIIVEKDVIDELLVELRMRTPDEIKKYQKIISSKEAILSDAKAQAEAMLADATKHTNELISEHEIMQQALNQANELLEQASSQAQSIIDSAVKDANEIREGAIGYTDELLKSLQAIISSSMQSSQSHFESFMSQMKNSLDVVTVNREQLKPQEEPEGSGEEELTELAEEEKEQQR